MVDYHTENATKRRKYDYTEEDDDHMDSTTITKSSTSSSSSSEGWDLLQPILENDVWCAKVPTSNLAIDLLAKWFQIIAADKEKLRVFRQWIVTSTDGDKKTSPSPNQLVPTTVKLADIKIDSSDHQHDDLQERGEREPEDNVPSTNTNTNTFGGIKIDTSFHTRASSIDYINNEIPITPRSTPQVLLLQQLLQKQQQQISILQKLQPGSTDGLAVVPTANTISLSPASGSAGVVLTVTTKNSPWHPFNEACSCTCGFTTPDGTVTSSQRVAGGSENEMRFVVPPIPFPTQIQSQIQMAVHLTSCAAPHAPIVCADMFTYGRERASHSNSDEDSEDTPDSSVCDEEENDDDDLSTSRDSASSSPSRDGSERGSTGVGSSPKQLMTVRERMLEFVQSASNLKASARIIVSQAPPNRVVWKNRRLDTPFKIRVEGAPCDSPSNRLAALALVVDHKGKLQIDAMENFDEECSPQGVALFHNLRMTKGTWGKEWTITFVAVLKSSLSTNPIVVGVSQPCPVVVKTRKNPQIRHVNRSESPVSFVESRKPDTSIRKRNRLEDILDTPAHATTSSSSSSSSSSSRSHSEAMTNLLYAAEIKQQEREYRPSSHNNNNGHNNNNNNNGYPTPPPSPPRSSSMSMSSMPNGFGSPDPNFANLQSLLGYLEDIKIKHNPNLSIVEQPQLKRDGKVLIVKKGKPFRTPFRLQMRTSPIPSSARSSYNQVPDYNPQQYVCVAVLRNDKGEEVALKNSEVLFDARGTATFSGLMVMKGTWGKSVMLTFEARWSGARRIIGGSNWPPLRMLVVAETPALQLMCYTKDKKTPNAV